MKRVRYTDLLFLLAGMASCLLSAYFNSFFAAYYHADLATATAEITPVVEELLKLLPILFYLLVFEPDSRQTRRAILMLALGFATFENICWFLLNGTGLLRFLLLRCLGSGALHLVCGAIIAADISCAWRTPWLKIAGTAGLLCSAVTFHAMYNLLLNAGGRIQLIGFLLPLGTAAVWFLLRSILQLKK